MIVYNSNYGTIDYNLLEAHTRGTTLPDFSSKIKAPRLVHKILSVQKHSPNRRTTHSRPPQNIILHVQKHFADRRSGLYGPLQANNYTFGEFFIIFHLTIHQKYNNLMYVRRTKLLPPANKGNPRKVS